MEYKRLTDLSLFYGLAHPAIISIKAPVKTDLQFDARAFDNLQCPVDGRQVERDRFFAKDVLACLGGLLDDLRVGVGRRTDDDRLNIRMIQQRPVIAAVGGNSVVRGALPGRLLDRVCYHEQVGRRDTRCEMCGVYASDASRADQAHLQCLCRHRQLPPIQAIPMSRARWQYGYLARGFSSSFELFNMACRSGHEARSE